MKMLRDSFIQKLFIKLTMVFILSCLVFYFIPNILVLIISFLFLIGLVYQYLKKRNDQVEELTQYIKTLNSGNYRYFLEAYDEGELGILYSELNKTMVTLNNEF
jgi:signal transduction histidine kinase